MGEKLKKRVRDLPLKWAFVLVITVTLLLSGGLSILSVRVCGRIQERLREQHSIVMKPGEGDADPGASFSTVIIPPGGELYAEAEKEGADWTQGEIWAFRAAEYAAMLLPVILMSSGIVAASLLLYHCKLKKPIRALELGIGRIANEDLDFVIEFDGNDEMGKLCRAFENMRRDVLENNEAMWKMAEERKRLNASVSHDIRTPVTIIRGYTEYLERNLPKGRISQEKLMETLFQIKNAAERLQQYAESVHDITVIGEAQLFREETDITEFGRELGDCYSIFVGRAGKEFRFSGAEGSGKVLIDRKLVHRVLENLTGNALRFARSMVGLRCGTQEGYVWFLVEDDGDGFGEELLTEKTGRPAGYRNPGGDGHIGMGLSICRALCEKHGGGIELSNRKDGGAQVIARIRAQ